MSARGPREVRQRSGPGPRAVTLGLCTITAVTTSTSNWLQGLRVTGELAVTVAEMTSKQHRRRVRVWFGEHVIAQYVAEAPLAARYEQAMRRRFAGLRVTNALLGPQENADN